MLPIFLDNDAKSTTKSESCDESVNFKRINWLLVDGFLRKNIFFIFLLTFFIQVYYLDHPWWSGHVHYCYALVQKLITYIELVNSNDLVKFVELVKSIQVYSVSAYRGQIHVNMTNTYHQMIADRH